jgi:hypothetical protein
MMEICAPALVYIFFTLSQIVIDIYNGAIEPAFLKIIVGIIVSGLLIILCTKGFSNVAWVIVLVPFIYMTCMVAILIFYMGYDFTTQRILIKNNNLVNDNENITTDSEGNIFIYNPEYDHVNNPVYYKDSYIVIPVNKKRKIAINPIPIGSSSPQF